MRTPMAYSFRLRFRKGYKEGRQQLQCRLRVKGAIASDYGSGIIVPVEHFDLTNQIMVARSSKGAVLPAEQLRKYNLAITRIKVEHDEIYERQKSLRYPSGKRYIPSAESVKLEWQKQIEPDMHEGPPPISVMQAYRDWYADPETRRDKDAETIDHYYRGLCYLERHLEALGTPNLNVIDMTAGWGLAFHRAIPDYGEEIGKRKRMHPGRASRYIRMLSRAIDRQITLDKLRHNPLSNLKLPRHKDKPIRFMNEPQVTKLWLLNLDQTADDVRKWALLCCYTGLDYADALEVARAPAEYTVHTEVGPKLIYQRLKANEADWGECHIPLLAEAEQLLEQAHQWPKLQNQTMNKYLHLFEGLIGCKHSITTKMLRRTAGAIFLSRGVRIETVQKILGHKFITTTQRHYVSILPGVVHDDMRKMMNNDPLRKLPTIPKLAYAMPPAMRKSA